ncbi:hypothetical protein DFR29_11178 [Tahibacter aquaticus]|uniref:Uncharacterized protein n=1 Tax=Tahibacter aquaticus TaxID=520092 RepID=A0A4R6YSN2_9GAMM|nr:hypothetical protein [Tahibacter aquaticus]TDR41166.1 hypothetical protein DFR29_11178 [Tahibacter aquaticus]
MRSATAVQTVVHCAVATTTAIVAMPIFVHIADSRDAASIRRNGLKLASPPVQAPRAYGVFALPVVPNFVVSHQWLREIKHGRFRTAIGVYFKVGGNEPVWAGHYNDDKHCITADQAAAQLREQGLLGYEVILPRRVPAGDIQAVRQLPQHIGWRHFPDAHERTPCGCCYCQRGKRGARRLRAAFDLRTRSPFLALAGDFSRDAGDD